MGSGDEGKADSLKNRCQRAEADGCARITKANYALASKKGEESRQKPSIIDILPRSVGQLRYSGRRKFSPLPSPLLLSPPPRRERDRRSPPEQTRRSAEGLLPRRKNQIRGRCPGDHGMQPPCTARSCERKGGPLEIEPSTTFILQRPSKHCKNLQQSPTGRIPKNFL